VDLGAGYEGGYRPESCTSSAALMPVPRNSIVGTRGSIKRRNHSRIGPKNEVLSGESFDEDETHQCSKPDRTRKSSIVDFGGWTWIWNPLPVQSADYTLAASKKDLGHKKLSLPFQKQKSMGFVMENGRVWAPTTGSSSESSLESSRDSSMSSIIVQRTQLARIVKGTCNITVANKRNKWTRRANWNWDFVMSICIHFIVNQYRLFVPDCGVVVRRLQVPDMFLDHF
jgi:hypothetical protein